MAHTAKFSPSKKNRRQTEPLGSPRSIADTIKFMLVNLPQEDREAILSEIIEFVRPIPVEKAGDVLGAVVKFIQTKQDVTVNKVKEAVRKAGIEARPKDVYNAMGYLARRGHIRRVGYGRYIVDGIEIVTAEDLGGASSRHEDGYRVDESDQ
ncbi:hypothetical protein EHI44_22130 [Rhizobium leguminosarum]|uniref:hypothetical protein n=1 Tax=Rhizobium leguminosarum TaxID=384 RepID=UPI000FEFF6F8|nr:hypothetical protein [Rhizobium leguminosarum]RWY83430.1 hypothetical protein EHI44_22130 [Rhizobium leguminosarum]